MSSTISTSVEELMESSDVETESDSDDSDLDDLYASFDYEDDVDSCLSQTQTAESTVESTKIATAHGSPSRVFPALSGADGPLYPGAQLSMYQSHLLIYQYAIRHSLTKKAFTELLQLLSVHVPSGAGVPKSVHSLKQVFMDAFPEAKAEEHLYCCCCQRPLPSRAHGCGGDGCDEGCPAVFITVPLGPQLKRMMEDPKTWAALQQRFQREGVSGIQDIYDGEGYKQHLEYLSHPGHVSLLLNTDGVAIYRSSKTAIWPVWGVVNELPPSLRFQRQHMILLGIFYSQDKPLMNTFLRPVIDDINNIYKHGIAVHTPDGVVTAAAILILCSLDLPARALVMNMKQWNGKFGCLYCEDEGTTVHGDHLHRYWPQQDSAVQRSHASMLINAAEAVRTGSTVCGVKGPTVLALHHSFNLVEGVVIDDLHGVFLGVTLSLLRLWFDKSSRSQPYYIGNKINLCDKRLLAIKVTDSMSRVPRSLEEFTRWKGAELRNWLLFFSLPVLTGILPNQYLCHLTLLVCAIYIFSSDYISDQSFLVGKCLLTQFHQEFSILYGVKATSMNVHMLSHLPECVRIWGPLWAYSCFHFENMNGYLKFLFHGTRDMSKQMAFSYVIMQSLPLTLPQFQGCANAVSTFANILYGKRTCSVTKQAVSEGVRVIGGVSLQMPLPSVLRAISVFLNLDLNVLPEKLLTMYRVEVRGTLFYCEHYQRIKKRNSYTVVYCENKLGQIQYFLYIQDMVIAVMKPLTRLRITCKDHFNLSTTALDTISFLCPVSSEDTFDVCFAKDIVCKCLYIDFDNVKYVVHFPSALIFD